MTLYCPECREPVWDGPKGHKLAKCWNVEGHANGGTLAFDTMEGGENMMNYAVIESTPGYMPDDDDPAIFDNYNDAITYLKEQREEILNAEWGYDHDTDEFVLEVSEIYGDPPRFFTYEDKRKIHDLGRLVEIVALEV